MSFDTMGGDPAREREANISQCEMLIDRFESEHDLGTLHALETQAEAMASEERAAAKADLRPIVSLLRELQGDPAYDELHAKYMKLSRAVGIINGGRVDHKR